MAKASNRSGAFLDRTSILNALTDSEAAGDVSAAFVALTTWVLSSAERYLTFGRTRDGSAVLITLKDGQNAEYFYTFSNSLQAALVVGEISNEAMEWSNIPERPTSPPKRSKSS